MSTGLWVILYSFSWFRWKQKQCAHLLSRGGREGSKETEAASSWAWRLLVTLDDYLVFLPTERVGFPLLSPRFFGFCQNQPSSSSDELPGEQKGRWGGGGGGQVGKKREKTCWGVFKGANKFTTGWEGHLSSSSQTSCIFSSFFCFVYSQQHT